MSDLKGPAGNTRVVSSGEVCARARRVRSGASFMKWLLPLAMVLAMPAAMADEFDDAARLFHDAGKSGEYFNHSYAHAVFPSVGKGGIILGAAHGEGKVYRNHRWIGDTSMTQVSVGAQVGGQTYAEIIFFKDKRAFDEFAAGGFSLAADVSAVVITSGASGEAAAGVTNGGASGGEHDATTSGGYTHGIAVFTIIKGGAMLQASVGGQKFTYKPRAD
jgi:lipid-binding SYLF domain-containing protein